MNSSLPADWSVSVVIPTRNRPGSLNRLLASLSRQTVAPLETIVIDASDPPAGQKTVPGGFPSLHLRLVSAPPSVCRQRNLGIAAASGRFILLADDDIEFRQDYIEVLLMYASSHPEQGAFSGILNEAGEAGITIPDRRPVSPVSLIWSFIFQSSVWGDIGAVNGPAPLRGILRTIRGFYFRRGNTFSLSGLPLVTDTRGDVYHTAVYGLGGALIRRDWLLAAAYDERLEQHGTGDHYGVAIQFPGPAPITVLATIAYVHHRETVNRLSRADQYRWRTLALDYFMRRSWRFASGNRLLLRWSVLGNTLYFVLRGSPRMAAESLTTFLRLCSGRNPYNIDRSAPPRR